MGNSVSYAQEASFEAPAAVVAEPAPVVVEEEEAEPELDIKVQTAPTDYRFPTTNQSRHCYTRYNEYYKCIAEKDSADPECKFYLKAFKSICPNIWVEAWEEQRENGTWPGKY